MKDYSPTLSHWIINFTFRSTMYYLRNWNFFSVFPYIYRNTSWSLWEREIPVGTRVISSDYLVFYFFYIKKNRKLKCGNSFRYQSVNSPYCEFGSWKVRRLLPIKTRIFKILFYNLCRLYKVAYLYYPTKIVNYFLQHNRPYSIMAAS